VHAIAVDVEQDDVSPLADERATDRQADAGRTARDDRFLCFEKADCALPAGDTAGWRRRELKLDQASHYRHKAG